MRTSFVLVLAFLSLAACAPVIPQTPATLQQQVMEAERAFARTMANRSLASFSSFLSEEAIFFNGEEPTRGKASVVAQWSPFFDGPNPPFSWEPDRVEVLNSGTLALSTGPVRNPAGAITGRFNSIWRRENGQWRVIFDKGSPVCNCASAGTQ